MLYSIVALHRAEMLPVHIPKLNGAQMLHVLLLASDYWLDHDPVLC